MGKRSLHFVLAAAMLAFGSGSAFPQSSGTGKKERHIGRGLGAIGGAVAGLMVGWAVSDDDAVNATAKLTRNWVIGAVAGGVGGYFLGRTIDRHIAFDARRTPDEIRWAQAKQVERVARDFGRHLAARTPEQDTR